MMREFIVGQKVVHPWYGAGTIVEVRTGHKDEEHEKYYVIRIPSTELTVHVPVEAAQEAGLRQPASTNALNRALDVLGTQPAELPKDYRERHALIVQTMQSGEVTSLAQIIRDLSALQEKKPLSVLESGLLTKAKRQLAGELALVIGQEMSEALRRIEEALRSER
ncbi:MAG: CarD family transcriptional regulator [Anaerolineae bacterium]